MNYNSFLAAIVWCLLAAAGQCATIIHAGRLIDGAATSRGRKCRS